MCRGVDFFSQEILDAITVTGCSRILTKQQERRTKVFKRVILGRMFHIQAISDIL